jgi:hypothetical protein
VVADGKLVPFREVAFHHTNAIDPDAVRTTQIAHHQLIAHLRHAAMSPGDLAGVELDVALGIATEEENRLVNNDLESLGEADELNGH